MVKRRVEANGGAFKRVEERVEFVLREVVKEEREKRRLLREEGEIQKRLKSLGYL